MTDQGHIFISYARMDGEEFAQKVHDDLERLNFNMWLDLRDIDGDWETCIIEALRSAYAVLVIVTPAAVLSPQVRGEYNDALNRYIPIIPLFVQQTDIPPVLTVFQWIDFRKASDYDSSLAELCQRLSGLHDNYLNYLHQQLNAFEIAQHEAPNPRRFDYKIQNLRDAIANWEHRVETQHMRVVDSLELLSKKPVPVIGRVVGQRLSNMTHHFRDRDHQLQEISRLLAEPSTRIVSVIGRGGMGKTALASKMLGDLEHNKWPHTEDHIPVDGIIYLSTRTTGISLERIFLSCAEMLGGERDRNLRSMWTNPEMKLEERVARLFETLQEGLYVILLDNMEDLVTDSGDIIDPDLRTFFEICLVTQHNARLFVTSRIPLAFRREVMHLDKQVALEEGLPTEHGVAMLRELDPNGLYGLSDAPESKLAQVVDLVHGVPRALEIVAGILANDPFTSLDDILKDVYGREQVVSDLVEENYKRLDANARRVVEALAVFGCPVQVVALDYLLEPFVPGLDAPSIVRRLVQTHLVSVDRSTKTVTLHPIDQDYAYSRIPEAGPYNRRALERRAADFYTQLRSPSDTWKSIADLEPQLAEFEHRVRAEEYDDAAQLVGEVDRYYLTVWGYSQRVLSMRQQLLGKLSDPKLDAENLGWLGYAYYALGQFEEAITYLERAEKISADLSDRVNQAMWMNHLGNNHRFLGHYDQALEMGENALTIARQANELWLEADCLNNLANLYHRLGQYEPAMSYHTQALELRRNSDKQAECSSLGNIGRMYRDKGNYLKALEYFEQALAIAQEIAARKYVFGRIANVGMIFTIFGRYKQAADYLDQALLIARETGNRRGENICLGYIGDVYYDVGEYQKAIETYRVALEIAHEIGGRDYESRHLTRLGTVFIAQAHFTEAHDCLFSALEMANDSSIPLEQLVSSTRLAQCFLLNQQLDDALERIQAAYQYKLPRFYFRAVVLYGIILLCLGRRDEAKPMFEEALGLTEDLLVMSPDYFAAKYARGLALIGMAFLSVDEEQRQYVIQAQETFAAALKNSSGQGVVNETLQLLNALSPLDETGTLDGIRAILGPS
jgi:tetratricopeptide (TPR) repeat protein/SAM-dependent methyltransferase